MAKQKTEQKIYINPPPSDAKCECCRKHIDKLKPFGGKGDPLNGDFTGAKLVKNFRAMTWHNKEKEDILFEISEQCRALENGGDGWERFEELLIEKVGKKKAGELLAYGQLVNTISPSWECRDCILLEGEAFFMKQVKSYAKQSKLNKGKVGDIK